MTNTQQHSSKHSVYRLAVALAMAGTLAACGGGSGGEWSIPAIPASAAMPAQPETRLSGQVRDAHGIPVAGVRVVLENRSTDDVFGAITSADGRYQVVAKPGVYDVLYDDLERIDWVSLQRTAVDLHADRSDDVVLQRAGAAPSNQISGRLTDGAGVSLAGRRLLAVPSIVRSPAALGDAPMPSPVTVQTGAEGRFSMQLSQPGQDVEFDVFLMAAGAPEIDVALLNVNLVQGLLNVPSFSDLLSQKLSALRQNDPPREIDLARAHDDAYVLTQQLLDMQLDARDRAFAFQFQHDYTKARGGDLSRYFEEQLDVEKPDGPMQLDIVAGHGVRNLRSASGAPSVVPEDAQALANQRAKADARPVSFWGDAATRVSQAMQRGLMSLIPPAEAGRLIDKFVPRWANPDARTGGFSELVLEKGRVDVAGGCSVLRLGQIAQIEGKPSPWQEQVMSQTTFCLHNKVHWLNSLRGDNQIVFRTPFGGRFHFTDRTGDTYSLLVLNFVSEHTVNFRSKQPDIVKMELTYN